MVYNQGLEARGAGTPRTAATDIADSRPGASRFRAMQEHENPFLRITEHDISEANQLSLSCPICGNAVENHTDGAALVPVVCDKCGKMCIRDRFSAVLKTALKRLTTNASNCLTNNHE